MIVMEHFRRCVQHGAMLPDNASTYVETGVGGAMHQVRAESGAVRVDAAVNSGNALASCAELVPREPALQLLASAEEAYAAATTQVYLLTCGGMEGPTGDVVGLFKNERSCPCKLSSAGWEFGKCPVEETAPPNAAANKKNGCAMVHRRKTR